MIKDILNLIYPCRCHLCGKDLIPGERFVCVPCIETLPRTGYHRNKRNPMENRFAGHFPFDNATGHFFYSKDSSLSQLIQDMKYRNFPSLGKLLGEIAGKELYISGFLNDIEYIIPVPMHFIKKAKRGYNQVDYIAEGIGKTSGIPVLNALKMTRQRKTQTSLSQNERLRNAIDLFFPRKNIDLNDKTVLLVDDICTTGATLGAAARSIINTFPKVHLNLFALGVTF